MGTGVLTHCQEDVKKGAPKATGSHQPSEFLGCFGDLEGSAKMVRVDPTTWVFA